MLKSDCGVFEGCGFDSPPPKGKISSGDTTLASPMLSNIRTLREVNEIDPCVLLFLQSLHRNWDDLNEIEISFGADLISKITHHLCNSQTLNLMQKNDCLVLSNNESEYVVVSMNDFESVRAFYVEGDVDRMFQDVDMDFVVLYLVATV